jgi:hypothetical protein
MWISKQMRATSQTADADLGVTTIAGSSVGVVTRGEVRALPVYGPGGYVWMPDSGETVLVIKGGPGGEEQCVAGTKQVEVPKGMLPGEVYLHGPGGGSLYLRQDGTVEIQGRLVINGQPYKSCDCEEESEV